MRNNDLTKSDPEFYFLPVEVVKNAYDGNSWGKVKVSDIPDFIKYKNGWKLISAFIGNDASLQ